MYKICAGKGTSEHVIFDPNRSFGYESNVYALEGDTIWSEEVDAAGSLTFTIPYNHPSINYVVNHKPYIYIYRAGAEVWRGRVTETRIAGEDKSKEITAEGDLAFLCDSIQQPYKWEDTTIKTAFTQMVKEHNAQVESSKEFEVGVIDNEDDEIDIENSSYSTTFELMQTTFIEGEGMHIRTRKGNGVYYLDLLEEGYGEKCSQKIQLGENLVSIDVSEETDELYTCLIPLGKSVGSSTSSGGSGGSTELVTYARSQIGNYGSDNNKFSQAVAGTACQWCHCFVSYCAKQVGLSTSQVPWTASTTEGMAKFKAWGRFHYKGSYTPSAGDIVYFKTGESHVAIVSAATSSSITIIEGNTSSDSVAERTISSGSHWWNAITGYGTYSSSSSTTEYSGTKHNAKFYCYSPGEGGYQDATGNSLQAYLDKGMYVCAVPSEIPLNTKLQIHVTSGNSKFNGRIYIAKDHGDSNITVGSDGTYGIDLLVASKSEQWSGTGTITILDDAVGGDGETESEESTVSIKNYASFEHEVSTGTIVHKKGKIFIYHKEAVKRYGRIFKAVQWSKTVSRKKLIKKAERRLTNHAGIRQNIEIIAIDLAELGEASEPIVIGARVHCIVGAYGVNGVFDCKSIKHIINDPAKSEYAFGNKKRRLTDYAVSAATNSQADDSLSAYDYTFDT